jgi:hypothetical protein
MDWLLGGLWDSIKQGLIEAILSQFTNLYDTINAEVSNIAVNVGQTPVGWNPGVYSMVRTLSETAVIPIAGMILTFVLCYELIQLIIEKNNMHEFDVFNIYKWIFKTFCAVYTLTHTFDLVMGVFALAQQVVNVSAGVITGSLDVGADAALANLETMLQTMGVFELIGLWLETFIIGLCLSIMTIVIFVIIFGRMIEIYLTVSVAPIPFATMANREWGQIGKYKIIATTNKGDTRVIADNLSTTQNNIVDCAGASLGLRNDEYVTGFTLVFGTVKAGFCQVEQPQIFVKVQPNLPGGYQFANKCDVAGKYGNEWIAGNSTWLTTIYAKGGTLPRTGY